MAPGTSESVRDRVVELRRVPAAELRANPKNWRRHPQGQVRALTSVLQQVGYADALLARETPDGLELIDGHLRAEITPEQEVPVLVLDVDQEEADLILATLDPLAAMAEADSEALEALLSSVAIDSADLAEYLAGQTGNGKKEGLTDPDEVPEAPAEPTTKRGDLWVLGDHRLLCGDAFDQDALRRLLGDSIAGSGFELIWSAVSHKQDILRFFWFGMFGSPEARERTHPTQKPTALLVEMLGRWSPERTIVADPFLGSGSTMIAAEQTGRRCYGMDIDPLYCDVAVKRWENFTGKTAELAT